MCGLPPSHSWQSRFDTAVRVFRTLLLLKAALKIDNCSNCSNRTELVIASTDISQANYVKFIVSLLAALDS
jgi:hypothetical protein